MNVLEPSLLERLIKQVKTKGKARVLLPLRDNSLSIIQALCLFNELGIKCTIEHIAIYGVAGEQISILLSRG